MTVFYFCFSCACYLGELIYGFLRDIRVCALFPLVVCFDAKINFDDNAEFRQKDIFAMDDKSENEPIENEAAKYDLKYIGLDGNIACFGKKVVLSKE